MKTNAIIRIVIWSIVLLLLISILGGVLLFDLYSFDQHEMSWTAPIITTGSGDNIECDYTTSGAEPITRIEIEWAAGSITIQPGDTDLVTFSEQGAFEADEALAYSQSGNKLSIRYQEQEVYIGIQSTVAKDLIITVPRDWQGESIEIEAAASRLEIRDITVRELDFDSASGEAIMENCAIENLDIDTASGDIYYSGTLDTLSFEAMSARLNAVLNSAPRALEVDTMSGDVDITLPASCGFTVNVDAMSSDFSSDFDVTKQNDTYLHGDGACRIRISAMSGDVQIRKGK